MKFFQSTQNFDNINDEVIKVLLQTIKADQDQEELQKMNFEKDFQKQFISLYKEKQFQKLFDFVLSHQNQFQDDYLMNVYLLFTFYLDKVVQDNAEKKQIIQHLIDKSQQSDYDQLIKVKILGLLFNFAKFDQEFQVEIFDQLVNTCQKNKFRFIQDYLLNLDQILDESILINERKLKYTKVCLEMALEQNNRDNIVNSFLQLVKLNEDMKILNDQIFDYFNKILASDLNKQIIDQMQSKQEFKNLLTDSKIQNQLNKFEDNDDFKLNKKIIELATQQPIYNTKDFLNKLDMKEDQKNELVKRLIQLNRMNYLSFKIDQRNLKELFEQ